MKLWKTIASLGLALALMFSQTAMAEVAITPLTPETAASLESQSSEASAVPQTQDGEAQPSVSQEIQLVPADKEFAGPGPQNSQQAPDSSGIQSQAGALVYTTVTTETDIASGAAGGSAGQTMQPPTEAQSLVQPEIKAQSAVLYDATNGRVLFEKDAGSRYYPASITKIMTALLVLENAGMDERVTFSETATTNLEAGAVGLDVTAGDVISVKDCLYGMMLKSANEVANGLAEHVGGSIAGFADMMNARAKALGCTGTHFNNPSGLNDSNHYTTAYDMALIAAEAFKNPVLSQITTTVNYTFPATKKVNKTRALTMGHKMVNPNDARYYEGIVGGKTGYTSLAGNTLVTCAERNGLRLVAVVLKSRQTHYEDTKSLLDYGFALADAGKGPGESAGGPGASGAAPGTAPQSGLAAGGNEWVQDESGWRFRKADGNMAANENIMIDGSIYHFDENSYMATGWREMNGCWYYFTGSGALAKNRWLEDLGSWFYVGENGCILTDTVTPDNCYVDATGRWIP